MEISFSTSNVEKTVSQVKGVEMYIKTMRTLSVTRDEVKTTEMRLRSLLPNKEIIGPSMRKIDNLIETYKEIRETMDKVIEEVKERNKKTEETKSLF